MFNKKVSKLASTAQEYITKKKNIPASITVDKIKYNYAKLNNIFAYAILDKDTKVSSQIIVNAPAPTGDTFKATYTKDEYISICKTLKSFDKEHGRNPNYILHNKKKINPLVLVDVLSRIIVFAEENNRLPKTADIDTSILKTLKVTSTTKKVSNDEVFNYFVKLFGMVKTIDEALAKIKEKGYGHYFNNMLTNKQVINNLKSNGKQKPNCTDIMQMLYHIGKALGYDVKIIHVKCKSSGEGHVFGKFRHKTHTSGKWITRDGACVISPNAKPLTCVWCANGNIVDTNPDWFMATVNV